jgi:hypothetical protein
MGVRSVDPHWRDFTDSGRRAVVIVQHAAQALAALNHICVSNLSRFGDDELVGQALVIALCSV